MRILQRNLKRTTDTFLFISHTTNVLLFKFRCSIFIGVRIIKEIPGSVASGTHCIKKLCITTVSLCNLYSYMFRHFRIIIREFTTNALLSYIHCLKLPDDETKVSKHVEVYITQGHYCDIFFGTSLLIREVSRSHTTTHHSR